MTTGVVESGLAKIAGAAQSTAMDRWVSSLATAQKTSYRRRLLRSSRHCRREVRRRDSAKVPSNWKQVRIPVGRYRDNLRSMRGHDTIRQVCGSMSRRVCGVPGSDVAIATNKNKLSVAQHSLIGFREPGAPIIFARLSISKNGDFATYYYY